MICAPGVAFLIFNVGRGFLGPLNRAVIGVHEVLPTTKGCPGLSLSAFLPTLTARLPSLQVQTSIENR